ncbi:MAG: DUF1330 domain-containing protein [Candidatus Latescibacterota bacterium]|nr:MAG: DUF1330 domain-containing protein [Candidatus Latescibacterota bacterium]
MSGYFVAQIDIHDQHEYDRYLNGFDDVFNEYDGEVYRSWYLDLTDIEQATLTDKWEILR